MDLDFPTRAAEHAGLLRAIAAGPADTLMELATRAGVDHRNLNRTLKGLTDEGIIVAAGDRSHQVALTGVGERALAALETFKGGSTPAVTGPTLIDPELIDANPFQHRTQPDPDAAEDMAQSITDRGILHPIRVRPHPTVPGRYQQAFGHRRVAGARLAIADGRLPSGFGVPAEIRDLTDDQMAEDVVIENAQHLALHWLDEAEGYWMLAQRGRSAAEVIRLVGQGGRKKRSVQILIQLAKELSPEDKARAYFPEGDPDRLSIEQAKFLVGNRKPRPEFELTDRLACALLELLDAGEVLEDGADQPVTVRLYAKPSSPGLVGLGDKGLVQFGVARTQPVATVPLTPEVWKWLTERGFFEDQAACLAAARAAMIGELAAGVLAADHRYYTPELNLPEAQPEPAAEPEPDFPGYLTRLAGPGGPPASPAPAAPVGELLDRAREAARAPEKPGLPVVHALAVIEIAHRLYRDGEQGPMGRMVSVEPYHRDPLANELVHARLVMFQHVGPTSAVSLTPTAMAWLDDQGVPRNRLSDEHIIEDEALLYRQVEAGLEPKGETYITAWLNPPRSAVAPIPPPTGEVARPEAETEGASTPEPDLAAEAEPAGPSPELQALQRLSAASREAARLLEKSRTVKLQRAELDTVLTLLSRAQDEADRLTGRA